MEPVSAGGAAQPTSPAPAPPPPPAPVAPPPALSAGAVVDLTVLRALSAGRYLLALGNREFAADSEVELKPGSQVRLSVAAASLSGVVLRLAEPVRAEVSAAPQRLVALRLPATQLATAVLAAFEEAGAPLDPPRLQAAVLAAAVPAAPSRTAQAHALLARAGLPVTPAMLGLALRAAEQRLPDLAAVLRSAAPARAANDQPAPALPFDLPDAAEGAPAISRTLALAGVYPGKPAAKPAARPPPVSPAVSVVPAERPSALASQRAPAPPAPAPGPSAPHAPAPIPAAPSLGPPSASSAQELPTSTPAPATPVPARPTPVTPIAAPLITAPAPAVTVDTAVPRPGSAPSRSGQDVVVTVPRTEPTVRPEPAAAAPPRPAPAELELGRRWAGSPPGAHAEPAAAAPPRPAPAELGLGGPRAGSSPGAAPGQVAVAPRPGPADPVSSPATRAVAEPTIPTRADPGSVLVRANLMQQIMRLVTAERLLPGRDTAAPASPATPATPAASATNLSPAPSAPAPAASPAAPPLPAQPVPPVEDKAVAPGPAALPTPLEETATRGVREHLAEQVFKPKELADYDRVVPLPLTAAQVPTPARLAVATRSIGGGSQATFVRVDAELSRLGPVSIRLSGVDSGGPLAITLIASPAGGGALAEGLPDLIADLHALGIDAAVRVASDG
jgi:hypothetical protein